MNRIDNAIRVLVAVLLFTLGMKAAEYLPEEVENLEAVFKDEKPQIMKPVDCVAQEDIDDYTAVTRNHIELMYEKVCQSRYGEK